MYSTCSFFQSQNEDVVTAFLLTRVSEEDAIVEEILGCKKWPMERSSVYKESLKFSPVVSGTSGLFIIKIRKIL